MTDVNVNRGRVMGILAQDITMKKVCSKIVHKRLGSETMKVKEIEKIYLKTLLFLGGGVSDY
jgi:hypothetical protein